MYILGSKNENISVEMSNELSIMVEITIQESKTFRVAIIEEKLFSLRVIPIREAIKEEWKTMADIFKTAANTVECAVETVGKMVDVIVGWIEREMKSSVNEVIKNLKSCIDGDKISALIRQTALDIEKSDGTTSAGKIGIDILEIVEYLLGISTIILTGIAIFASAELLWYAASDGIGAVVSEIVAGMLKNVVLSLLLTGVTVETLNEVGEKTGGGIDNPVLQALLKMFSLSSEFAGMIWDVYKVLVEKAKCGKIYFYIGLSMAIGAFIASTVGSIFVMTGDVLKIYDSIVCAISITGLGLMYMDRAEDIGKVLPLTSLLEWCVGWAGVISSFIKLSADAAAGFGE